MLVVMNKNATPEDIQRVSEFLESKGFEARVSHGEARILVHAIGVKDVDICPYCTVCNNDLFYSYRKENGTKNRHHAV